MVVPTLHLSESNVLLSTLASTLLTLALTRWYPPIYTDISWFSQQLVSSNLQKQPERVFVYHELQRHRDAGLREQWLQLGDQE